MDTFWAEVNTCLDELETARTADAVIDGLNAHFFPNPGDPDSPGCGDAFFPGSGGDRTLLESLSAAGWTVVWAEAPYFYVARNAGGELLTYIEGDVYRGDHR